MGEAKILLLAYLILFIKKKTNYEVTNLSVHLDFHIGPLKMDYFFDSSVGANFGGGDYEFGPQPGGSSVGLPDFTAPSHLDHQAAYGAFGATGTHMSFYGSSESYGYAATSEDGLRFSTPPANEASSSSTSSSSSVSPVAPATVSSLSNQLESPAFHDAPQMTCQVIKEEEADCEASEPPPEAKTDAGANFERSTCEEVQEAEPPEVEAAPPEEDPTLDININNVVCSFSVRCHLNLRKVALEGCNTQYNKERAMVSMKLRKPKITASIWNSGKITCIGATSENDAKIGARRVARILERMGINVHFCRFRVVNVLASCTLPFAIRLHKFSERYPKEVEYEPELHPGATYKLKNPKATLKIFSTGSITITCPYVSHVQPAVEHIFPRVKEFRMDEKDKESGEMAKLVPKAFVPLNTKHGVVKHIPKGPFHSKFKQVIHQKDLVKKAIQQVRDYESSDDDAMYMGYDDD